MSSFPRVLRQPVEAARPTDVADASPSEAAVTTRVLRQPSLAHQHGHAPVEETPDREEMAFNRGVEQGREAARQQLMSASTALQSALEEGRLALRSEFERQRDELVELAIEMATLVSGHEHHDGGVALRERIDEALAILDDDELVIAMHEVDIPMAADIAGPGIRIVPDRALEPGEARIMGQWARADLTKAAAQAILKESLG